MAIEKTPKANRRPGASARSVLALFGMSVVIGFTLAPMASASSGTFRIGYADPELSSESSAARDLWDKRAFDGGGSIARINVPWRVFAPTTRPRGFDATNPASPGYSWQKLDAAVRSAVANGLEPMLTVQRAPAWAESPGRPAAIETGTWKPHAGAYGEFGQALAARYSGHFPDPLVRGASLPRVRLFDAWNEANLVHYLAPQVANGHLVGPLIYRKLLNHFYAGVKKSQPGATVVGSGLVPYGSTDGQITPPVIFLRSLLCLHGTALKPTSCPEKAHLDAVAVHPIQLGPPTQSAESPLDVTTPDLGRLTAVVDAAQRAGTIGSKGRPGLWVTEFWVDSSPPDPHGIPLAKQARWYEQDLYEYWKQGAEVAIELQLRDFAPGSEGYPNTLQSGTYFLDGRPKPSATAMRFPFVAQHAGNERTSIWGIAPQAGMVRIQALRGGSWKTLTKVRARGRSHPFTAVLDTTAAGRLRARVGSEQSLVWRLG